MRYKVLIIGLGQIGVGYDVSLDMDHVYSHARAFSQHKRFILVGGVDSDAAQCRRFEQVYQCPAYESIDEALKKHQPEVVVLALPTALHGEAMLQILENAALKLVLCEKPLAYDLNEAQMMVEACSKKGVLLYVNYMRRSQPGVIEVKRRLDMGLIKTPIKGVVWYSKGFYHNGSHFFNLLEYWLGSYSSSNILDRGRRVGNHDKEPDVHITFEKGTVSFLAAWEEAFSHYTIELLSPSGRLRYEKEGQILTWEKLDMDPCFQGYTILSDAAEPIHSGMNQYQLNVVSELAKALNGEEAHLCTGKDALQTLNNMQHSVS